MIAHLRPLIEALDRSAPEAWTAAMTSKVDADATLTGLAEDIALLTADQFAAIAHQSREVTTHYAWCLFDDERRPYSLWINEYKPTRDWLEGYANVIHNHRYDFCSTILAGGYVEQAFDVRIASDTKLIIDADPATQARRERGTTRLVRAEDFHRIPRCDDGTVSLLVKSRPRQPASVSFDPGSRSSRIHVPIEARRDLLIDGLAKQRRPDGDREGHREGLSRPPGRP